MEKKEKLNPQMKIKVHRGLKEIGGSCIEVTQNNTRIVLDFGMPLVKPGTTSQEQFNFKDYKDKDGPELAKIITDFIAKK